MKTVVLYVNWSLQISSTKVNTLHSSIGRANYDLAQMEIDKTHDITVNLEDDAGSLRLLVTITGAVSSVDHEVGATARGNITRKYVSVLFILSAILLKVI